MSYDDVEPETDIGTLFEQSLKETREFEERINSKRDRDVAILESRIEELYDEQVKLESRIVIARSDIRETKDHAQNASYAQWDITKAILHEGQRQLRELSILAQGHEMNLTDEMATLIGENKARIMYQSKWLVIYAVLSENDKPVNRIDLHIVLDREYDLETMDIPSDYWNRRHRAYQVKDWYGRRYEALSIKSFKSEDDAWAYYERNSDRLYKTHVLPLADLESAVSEIDDPKHEFDRSFDFRLIYLTEQFGVGWSGYPGVRELDVKKRIVLLEMLDDEYVVEYIGDLTIEVSGQNTKTIEAGGFKQENKTPLMVIRDAIHKGAFTQICVKPENMVVIRCIPTEAVKEA